MPFRHVAMFRWAEHVDGDHVQRVVDAFDQLAELPGVRHHAHGRDVGFTVGAFDFHVVADFETAADWSAYRDHPAHVVLLAELIDPNTVDQIAGQFHVMDAPRHDGQPGTLDDERDDQLDDDELLARARRAAMAQMTALLAEPDDPL